MILTIDRNTFIWVKNKEGYVYNTSNYQSFKFSCDKHINHVIKLLNRPESLYMVDLGKINNSDSLNDWVNNIIQIDSGRLFKDMADAIPSMKPILKIENDRIRILKRKDFLEMINCVSEITIHLNGSPIREEEYNLHKQYPYPTNSTQYIDFKSVLSFINQFPETITLKLIADFSSYPDFFQLISALKKRKNKTFLYTRIEDLTHVEEEKRKLLNDFNVTILCRINYDLDNYIKFTKSYFGSALYAFICFNKTDFVQIENIETQNINYSIVALYNGKNIDFLQEYVFLSKQEIESQKLEKRNIFINQTLNGFFFGKLIVFPDGSVQANANTGKIGHIGNKLISLLRLLLQKKSIWFNTRNCVPCNRCIYQWVCPPISNYELTIGKTNLCY